MLLLLVNNQYRAHTLPIIILSIIVFLKQRVIADVLVGVLLLMMVVDSSGGGEVG